jgi:hypothetical protein
MVTAYWSLSEASDASCAFRYSTLLLSVRMRASDVAVRAAMVDSPSLYLSERASERESETRRDEC